MIDTHCHLDSLQAGRRRAGRHRARARRDEARDRRHGPARPTRSRSPPRREFDGVSAIVGRHPNAATGWQDSDIEEIERAAAQPGRRRRSARPASTTSATAPRATTSAAPSSPSSTSPGALELPIVIHTRAAEDDTFAMLAEHADGHHGDPALLLGARPRRGGVERGLLLLVRRQRHLQERRRSPGRRRARFPTSCCWSRPTRPT